MNPEVVTALERVAEMSHLVCASGACLIGRFGCCDRAFCTAVRRGIGDAVEWRDDQRLPYMGENGCRVPAHLRPACSWHICNNVQIEEAAEAMRPFAKTGEEFDALMELITKDPDVKRLVDEFKDVRVSRDANREGSVKLKDADKAAVLSECGTYRFQLERCWDRGLGTCLWIMLNPSTADAHDDDPTIRKCMGFASRWGYGRIVVVNLYAFRATKPQDLWDQNCSVIGPGNDKHIVQEVGWADRVVCAWGNHARQSRVRTVMEKLGDQEVWHLGLNKNGSPKHPLMLAYVTVPKSLRAHELIPERTRA